MKKIYIRLFLSLIIFLNIVPVAKAQSDMPRANPELLRLAAGRSNEKVRVIIQLMAGATLDLSKVERMGAENGKELPLINGMVVDLPVRMIDALSRSPEVRWMTVDAPMISAQAASGFSEQGMIKTAVSTSAEAYATTIQADGKVLIAGTVKSGGKRFLGIARRSSNGDPDKTFGTNGFVLIAIGNYETNGLAITTQRDGKIIAAGQAYTVAGWDFAVARFNANGTLDTTFDTDGQQLTDVSGNDAMNQVLVQADGKIIVAGAEQSSRLSLVRYNSNGSLDTSFGSGGKLITTIMRGNSYSQPVALQSDGKIVVTGANDFGTNRGFDVVVARFNSNGSLDTSFGTNGLTGTAIGSGTDRGNSLAIQADGKIVVTGIANDGKSFDIAVLRYNSNGSLDTTFDGDGIVVTALKGADFGLSLALQADGKIVVSGVSNTISKSGMALLRYMSNGALDTTMAGTGYTVLDIGGLGCQSYSMALQPDGKIVLAGYVYLGPSSYNFATVRLRTDGQLDIPISPFAQGIGATRLQAELPNLQGEGITVAVVDSGIADVQDLKVAGSTNSRILASVDFTGGGNTNDVNGHGTFVAGVLAGNGSLSGGLRTGVAPKVNLINLKVSSDQGLAYMSDVIESLQWIYQNKAKYNIRVVNLSLNSSVPEAYHVSPLSAATEILWFNGITVVVAAGNNGNGSTAVNLLPPANDPFVITVGAADSMGTLDVSDDTVAPFSAYGLTESGFAKPDLVAPGRNVVSLLASKNALVYLNYSAYRVDDYAFRMSGTSASTPMVSSAVALLLQNDPRLTPDQIKYRLKATAATNWAGYSATKAGAGYLNVYAAVKGTSTQSANTGIAVSQLLYTGLDPVAWNSVNWNSVNWNSVNWNSVNWNSVNWNSINWNSKIWESGIWDEQVANDQLGTIDTTPYAESADGSFVGIAPDLQPLLPNEEQGTFKSIFLPLVSR